jgi:hypothetical protein
MDKERPLQGDDILTQAAKGLSLNILEAILLEGKTRKLVLRLLLYRKPTVFA